MRRRTIRRARTILLVAVAMAATVALAPAAAAARPEPAPPAPASGHLEVLLKVPPSVSSQATGSVGQSFNTSAETLDDFTLLVGSSPSSAGGPSAGPPVAGSGSAVAVMGVDKISLGMLSAVFVGGAYRSPWIVELVASAKPGTPPVATYSFSGVVVASWLLQAGPTTTTVQVTFRYTKMTLKYSSSNANGTPLATDTWNVTVAKRS